ncbi:xanthine phosphoribosyltransferase [bacterium]|nr:xanthine phosphoribosyltransferase [bacterium]
MEPTLDKPANLFLTWPDFHDDCRQLAKHLLKQNDQSWRGIIAVARGGLIPAAILARELNIRLVDTLCVASYDHQQQGEAKVLKGLTHDGDGYLVVDDLVDTGNTANIIRATLPKARFVVVYAKPQGQALVDDAIRHVEQDTWIHFPWDLDNNGSYTPPLIEAQQRD